MKDDGLKCNLCIVVHNEMLSGSDVELITVELSLEVGACSKQLCFVTCFIATGVQVPWPHSSSPCPRGLCFQHSLIFVFKKEAVQVDRGFLPVWYLLGHSEICD